MHLAVSPVKQSGQLSFFQTEDPHQISCTYICMQDLDGGIHEWHTSASHPKSHTTRPEVVSSLVGRTRDSGFRTIKRLAAEGADPVVAMYATEGHEKQSFPQQTQTFQTKAYRALDYMEDPLCPYSQRGHDVCQTIKGVNFICGEIRHHIVVCPRQPQ